MIWSRKRGLSCAISLKTDTISDMNARMYWSSLLYGKVMRFSTLTIEMSCLRKKAVCTGPFGSLNDLIKKKKRKRDRTYQSFQQLVVRETESVGGSTV